MLAPTKGVASLGTFPPLSVGCGAVASKAPAEFDVTVGHCLYLQCMVADCILFLPNHHFSMVWDDVANWL